MNSLTKVVPNFTKRSNFLLFKRSSLQPKVSCDDKSCRQHSTAVATNSEWDRAMSNAERVVGSSTSYFSSRCLLSDEISNVALHLSKLNGTNHPLLETAKRLTYTGDSVMQTRGLITLLMSKAAGHLVTSQDYIDAEKCGGISQRQRSLAEMTEMIYSAHLIHHGILNLQPNLLSHSTQAQELHFGNKMSVLSGDFLLASVWKGLGELRNSKVVELMSTAIGDHMEGQFIIENESNKIEQLTTTAYWEERNFLQSASLQANSCTSALSLADLNEDACNKAYQFGKNFALAWQAFNEIQPFLPTNFSSSVAIAPFELMSAPVLLHFEETGLTVNQFQVDITGNKILHDIELFHQISNGYGTEKTKQLIAHYSDQALDALKYFPPSESIDALSDIAHAVREV